MLSGIAGLKCKFVKMQVNACGTVHWSRVFCHVLLRVLQNLLIQTMVGLCKGGRGQLIYNFVVDHLVHLCFEISSNQQSNSATLSFKMSQPRYTRDVVRDTVAAR
jgi:hypothetical protein